MASIESSGRGMPKQNGIADLIVKGAIALVTAAFFIGAYLQFQVTFWLALIAALSVYIMLLMLHALMRRSEREDALVSEVSRLEGEVARLRVGGRRQADDSAPAPTPTAAFSAARQRGIVKTAATAATPPPLAPVPAAPPVAAARDFAAPSRGLTAPAGDMAAPMMAEREPQLSTRRMPSRVAEPAQRPEPVFSTAPLATDDATLRADQSPSLPHWPAPPASDSVHDYWPARSAKPTLPESPRAERREPAALPPAERDADLDAVHGMIKRLSDEVSVAGEGLHELTSPPRQESALRTSLNALQTTASAMRASRKKAPPAPAIPAAARRELPPGPPPIMATHARLASLADAVTAGRVDVALAPIVGLADHQVHYYEVLARPCDERGVPLPVTARDPQLATAGLLPLLDTTRLSQSARVARSYAEEGKERCLFASATAESLATDRFLDELADAYREREALAGELVLMFAQADIRTFGGSEWSALTDMRDLGFRFGIEDVTDFDYEFTALCAAGFAFVKLDAATLLGGLASPNGVMPAGEVCRNLGELGLTLVVSRIDDEATRAKVLEAGVPLGQGELFGPPLSVPGDGYAAAGHAAA